jgi:hypothetical protein
MSTLRDAGIGGILDRILSPAEDGSSEIGKEGRWVVPQAALPNDPPGNESMSLLPKKPGARRGRPLGKGRAIKEPKEKVTVWLNAKLIADYRDWSWEARCPLSTLVERALLECRKNQRNRGSISP